MYFKLIIMFMVKSIFFSIFSMLFIVFVIVPIVIVLDYIYKMYKIKPNKLSNKDKL